jgi:lipoprotein-releasing system permease protein
VKNPEKIKDLKELIISKFPQATIYDWQSANSHFFNAIEVQRNVMFLILTLIILVAVFNIISCLAMLVKDKTKDIAILRTLGAPQKMIMKIFFLTGSFIGLGGTFLGAVVGLGFSYNIENIRQLLERLSGAQLFQAEIYFLSKLPSKVDLSEVAMVVAVSLILSFLATIYPSWKAARLNPVEGLRYE